MSKKTKESRFKFPPKPEHLTDLEFELRKCLQKYHENLSETLISAQGLKGYEFEKIVKIFTELSALSHFLLLDMACYPIDILDVKTLWIDGGARDFFVKCMSTVIESYEEDNNSETKH